jgi:hypothetical protein
MSRILVCGGRSYADFTSVSKALVNIHLSIGILFLIHGGVSGADALANTWAVKYGVPVKSYPPNWEAHGERAVGVRNALMIADGKPHLVVAFPGGPGTVDLLEKVAVAGLPVWRPAEETLRDVVGRWRGSVSEPPGRFRGRRSIRAAKRSGGAQNLDQARFG